MNIEKIRAEQSTISVLFHDLRKELVDIDLIFKQTNKNYVQSMEEMGLTPKFDFDNKFDKKSYYHQFLYTICEFLKNKNSDYSLCFYNNSMTKDKFRNILLKKTKKIFGFRIWDDMRDLDTFIQLIEKRSCIDYSALELFFELDRTQKKFKYIRNFLEKEGLTFLNDSYFNDLSNKFILFR